jgi:hypothetical protein
MLLLILISCLLQKNTDTGELQLLSNDYAARWHDFCETYLMEDHSIPMFLAAITMQLYQEQREQSNVDKDEEKEHIEDDQTQIGTMDVLCLL